MAPKRFWKKKTAEGEWSVEGRVSEQELLNRVILAKALQVHASGQTMQFRTRKEVLEITPQSAEDVMRASGQHPKKIEKKTRHAFGARAV